MDTATESKKEYSPKYGRRSKGAKRNPTLKSDGLEFSEGTEAGSYVQDDPAYKRPKKAKTISNLSTSKEPFSETTETVTKYVAQYGRRAKVAKPSTHLEHGGLDFKEGTENSSYDLNNVDVKLPERFSSVDNIKMSKNAFEKMTEYHGRHNTAATKGLRIARLKIDQELTTPYGNMPTSAIRLGQRHMVAAVY